MSKKSILDNIKKNLPDISPLPALPSFSKFENPLEKFTEVSAISSTVKIFETRQGMSAYIEQLRSEENKVVDARAGDYIQRPEDINYLIVEGILAVAENGAIWIDETKFLHRIFPFVTQHLVLLINSNKIVSTMHQAYESMQVDQTGFGVFIAGPSKTADIEQSLVIGAQGARSMTVLINTGNS